MIDISILRVMRKRDGYDKLFRTIPVKALDPKTATLVKDVDRYYREFETHEEIDYVIFKDMFFMHWHRGLDEELVKYYTKILSLAEKETDEVTEAVLVNSLLELTLANNAQALLDAYNEGEELDLMHDMVKLVEEIGEARERKTDHNWIQTPIGELLAEDEDDSGLHWRINVLESTTRPLRTGDFVIAAGRPDTGKTTFIAGEATHMAPQVDDRPILWLNNEGDGGRILKRVIQSAINATVPEMIELSKAGTIMEEYEKALGAPSDRIRVIDIHDYWNWQVADLVQQHKPKLVIMDMIDNIKFSGLSLAGGARTDQILESMYQWARTLAVKEHMAVIATSQISNEGEGEKFPALHMLKDSKTGKQGAAELQIMIGRSDDPLLEPYRYLSTPKNKLRRSGAKMPRAEVLFDIDRGRYKDIGEFK